MILANQISQSEPLAWTGVQTSWPAGFQVLLAEHVYAKYTNAAGVVTARMAQAALAYFSGITLSLYSPAGLDAFERALRAAKQAGARIAFDGNFRPRGWGGDKERAGGVFQRFLALCDVALPTFDDEQALWGDSSPADTIARLGALGVREVAVKNGADGALVHSGGVEVHAPVPERIIA
ncbi:MAG: hypothetical protein J0H63_12470, partial [Rhizobiales bacterium]|nr:hypothetical protein [Hyphomicrobiales bacterium]